VAEPFDPGAAIDWTPAWSLSRGERRYVPLAYCYAEAPPESGIAYCQPGGNGVAAGNCLEEAILQGLLELVERDAAGMWWYSRAPRPAWDLDSFGDAWFDALRGEYARLGWDVWTLDLTHDLGIPVCAALARDPAADRFAIGFGCHLDAHLAVQRALTELNQLFDPESHRRAPWDVERLSTRAFLCPDPEVPCTRAGARPRLGGDDLGSDVDACVGRLGELDLEVVVVDKTRPDIGLSVAQVIVPGLCHFWPRFGHARLYRIPVELGWVREPLVEGALNPVPLWV
jgi:ribosomal protein S12 methylthiotransferase accessory factor